MTGGHAEVTAWLAVSTDFGLAQVEGQRDDRHVGKSRDQAREQEGHVAEDLADRQASAWPREETGGPSTSPASHVVDI